MKSIRAPVAGGTEGTARGQAESGSGARRRGCEGFGETVLEDVLGVGALAVETRGEKTEEGFAAGDENGEGFWSTAEAEFLTADGAEGRG